jgi:hypothetical protein
MLAKDLDYLTADDYHSVDAKRSETARMLQGLLKSLS